MTDPSWEEPFERLAAWCAASGLDLAAAGRVGAYNAVVPAGYQLPDFGDPRSLVIVIGNTRALWPRFVAALQRAQGAPPRDPLDRYVEDVVERAAAELSTPHALRFAHAPPPRRVAIQQLARVTGLAALSPAHLSVHPDFGPWIALRAAVVVACRGPEVEPRCAPCAGCAAPCAVMLQRALDAKAHSERDWPAWLAIRDACPVGRAHRYDERQIRYHYSKDAGCLM